MICFIFAFFCLSDDNSIYAQSYIYKDALIRELKGNVKSVTYYTKGGLNYDDEYHEGITVEYNNNGSTAKDPYLDKVIRDKQNRITEISCSAETLLGVKTYRHIYEYDNKGNIKTEITYIDSERKKQTDYFYDSKGNVIKEIEKDISESDYKMLDQIVEYEYVSFDDRGNWTERKFVDIFSGCYESTKRVIEYY